ncbi:primosomal replication protein PriC [Rheinheimera nanhaiensis]|uniref:Primosomal replication protein N n=1 Tax=Rheinheimera nanhaiensis E407-8 TaxID=562729 RepID=I1DZ95_9GAMM|nr:primosomal replication protein PriC [Rheinheimera nanhaiensis]GAB59373.1 hypothetical protein RNAN_2375 [Rheinheimera nanhaiensis E407-8]
MDLLATLTQQLAELKRRAQQIDRQQHSGKPQHWFDSALFSCRSAELSDYVAEAQRNLAHLQQNRLTTTAQQRLVRHLSEQTAALTRAFRNVDTRQKTTSKAKVKALVQRVSASSQQLYQQLSEVQQFERRLLDMIALASRDNSAEAVARTLALHARLGRCRRALSDLELQIQQLEQRGA